ncbi:hypothetical protein CLOLEP_00133 [[Clostridium] leptum DSM 753]|uniref:Uncharacterized protein n=1 Tax=[Clostridium] leptum DSM 753 TaxID=428125 RepID=A7VNK7_9FIRM|nr:hypothetical protein CLOLEP_00133 [[Clostridium] leptum DSM 753]
MLPGSRLYRAGASIAAFVCWGMSMSALAQSLHHLSEELDGVALDEPVRHATDEQHGDDFREAHAVSEDVERGEGHDCEHGDGSHCGVSFTCLSCGPFEEVLRFQWQKEKLIEH